MAEEQQKNSKKKKDDGGGGAPAWMVTYSDMVTLLLTFFVLLLSMANMDPVKFTEASSSLKDAFGVHSRPAHVEFAIPILPSPPVSKFTPVASEMTQKIYKKIKTQIDSINLTQSVDVEQRDNDTIVLRIKDTILFGENETKITPKSYPLLRFIADIIRSLPFNLTIEGHTDTQSGSPIELEKWDTSIARSVSVLRFLTKSDLLPLERMAATGYGSTKPVADNTTEEGRAQNRRVDFVLRSNKSPGEGSHHTSSSGIPF